MKRPINRQTRGVETLGPAPPLDDPARVEALMLWLASLGKAAKPALALVRGVRKRPAASLPKSARAAAKRALERIEG